MLIKTNKSILLSFSGNLYGLEKFWAFLKYYKGKTTFEVSPNVKQVLEPFKHVDDFRREVNCISFFPIYLLETDCVSPICQ